MLATTTSGASPLAAAASSDDSCEPAWTATFGAQPGTNGHVYALAWFGDLLCVGGEFSVAGANSFQNIVAWDGSAWSALGEGVAGSIHALAVFDDGTGTGPALYAGGQFTSAGGIDANRIAKWDGESWSPLGEGLNGTVRSLAVFDDGGGDGPALVAGGDFTEAGGEPANRIARWSGKGWSPLGSGVSGSVNPSVRAMAVFDDGSGPALFATGSFTSAGGTPASYIARWDGTVWAAVGGGLNGGGLSLLVHGDGGGEGVALYVGGSFSAAGGGAASRIARWDGKKWSPLGAGIPGVIGSVSALATWDGGTGPRLYAGGSFVFAGGGLASNIASWDGTTWAPLGAGLNGDVRTMAGRPTGADGRPRLFVGGHFITSQGLFDLNRIACWDGSAWSPLGAGLSGSVEALAIHDDSFSGGPALYAAGTFDVASGELTRRIARWDGSGWAKLADGLHGNVYALASFVGGNSSGPVLVAGGEFITSGQLGVARVAQWDGLTWSPLGEGLSGTAWAMAVQKGQGGESDWLFVGGGFLLAGGITANNIARWDGIRWASLGNGLQNVATALAVIDDGRGAEPGLYAGGYFLTAGTVNVNRVARWNGTEWRALGDGLNGAVFSLAAWDDGNGTALYAGGEFTMSGSAALSRIARWDGSSWSEVGGGVNGTVRSLVVFDDGTGGGPALFVGGDFTAAGGLSANRLAKWDGRAWSALGSGMSASVRALLPLPTGLDGGPALVAGGSFGTTPFGDSFVARWATCPLASPCGAADLDGDGGVGPADLSLLLGQWGGPGPADLDADGMVGAADLALLLGCWE